MQHTLNTKWIKNLNVNKAKQNIVIENVGELIYKMGVWKFLINVTKSRQNKEFWL